MSGAQAQGVDRAGDAAHVNAVNTRAARNAACMVAIDFETGLKQALHDSSFHISDNALL